MVYCAEYVRKGRLSEPRQGTVRFGSAVASAWSWGVLLALLLCSPALGQGIFGLSTKFELSESVSLNEVGAEAEAHLQRVQAFRANEQWDEVIETLRRVMENHGERVIAVSPRRYVNARDYCHLQLAALPPEALELYRARVDAQARQGYEEGIAGRNAERLRQVADELFCSSWGDDALLALGEMALEQGDYSAARGYWEKLVPPSPPSEAASWLAYPGTDIPQADIFSRLILVSILEQSPQRARQELEAFSSQYADASGRLGGQTVTYVDALGKLLDSSESWPRTMRPVDWPTFGGAPQRTLVVPQMVDIGAVKWRQALPRTPEADFGYPPRRVGEAKDELLSYHPVVVGDLVLVASSANIYAFNLHTGEPVWGSDPIIFSDTHGDDTDARRSRNVLGATRFTLTVHGDKLLARMGNPVTCSPHEPLVHQPPGYLVCLDLAAEGRLLWRSVPPEGGWAYEGAPLCDGPRVYVAMRRGDVRPQSYVVCLDADTGRPIWEQLVCAAETPAQGQVDEATHNLLTLHGDTIYANTNLGAVAALATHDGRIRWITLYERTRSGDLNRRATHFYRDLTPCIHDRGKLFVAPADSRHIFALDAPTGMLLWETSHPEDAVHLLGVGGGNLLASGDSLWWIDVATGKLASVVWSEGRWPDGPSPKGFGRGILVADKVLWPTRTPTPTIHVFDQTNGMKLSEIELSMRAQQPPLFPGPPAIGEQGQQQPQGAPAGNLVVAGGYLLIATHNELVCLDNGSAEHGTEEVTRSSDRLPADRAQWPAARLVGQGKPQ